MCATVDGSGHSASIGFAVALTPDVRGRIERLTRGEEIVYGYVGVACGPADDAAHVVGARINRVDAQAPAAGVLMPGDVIQKFDGVDVDGDATFGRLASLTPTGPRRARPRRPRWQADRPFDPPPQTRAERDADHGRPRNASTGRA